VNTSKFSVTALLLVAMIFSAIGLLFMVKFTDVAYRPAINEFFPIEGTEYSVKYSSKDKNGIYRGDRISGELLIEGDFGYDWGAAAEGDYIYLNEYRATTLGMMLCDLVRVDTNTGEKELLSGNTILRGRCASVELVCLRNVMMPSNSPKINSLCMLYGMSSAAIRPEDDGAEVAFLDPLTGQTLYSVRDEDALSDAFEAEYLERTLEEVRV